MRQSAWLKRLGYMLRAKRQHGQAVIFVCSRLVEPNKPKKPDESDSRHASRNGSSRKDSRPLFFLPPLPTLIFHQGCPRLERPLAEALEFRSGGGLLHTDLGTVACCGKHPNKYVGGYAVGVPIRKGHQGLVESTVEELKRPDFGRWQSSCLPKDALGLSGRRALCLHLHISPPPNYWGIVRLVERASEPLPHSPLAKTSDREADGPHVRRYVQQS